MNLDLRLFQLIEEDLGERLERHAAELVTGKALDWGDYKFRIGQLKGLREALAIAQEANRRAIGLEAQER